LDPENKATVVQWAQDNFNENKILFPNPLELDIQALANYTPPSPIQNGGGGEEDAPRPFAASA
jgi:hypothetical protein